jgi:hypothetical protein
MSLETPIKIRMLQRKLYQKAKEEPRGWMAKVDVGENGGMHLDRDFLLEFDGLRPHQVHLEGGDASSDSYCYSG